MNALPEGFRLLENDELSAAVELRDAYVSSLEPSRRGVFPGRNECVRIVYACAASSMEEDEGHMEALRRATAGTGDQRCWIVADVGLARGSVPGPAALEVDLQTLADFAAEAAFRYFDETWIPTSLISWPPQAVELVAPVATDSWFIGSPLGTWGFVDTRASEFSALAGSRELMRKYREVNPHVVFDPLLWLHADGHYLTWNFEADPSASWISKLFRTRRVPVTRLSPFLRRYLESFYSRADSDWLWQLFVETEEELSAFGGDFDPDNYELGWKDAGDNYAQAFADRPDVVERLTEIWDNSTPG